MMLPPSTKECNYKMYESQTSLTLTDSGYYSIMSPTKFIMKLYFIINLMVFIFIIIVSELLYNFGQT